VNILLVNWQDLENPDAGGAEIHLFELFRRIVRTGHRVHLVCSGWRGAARTAVADGISIERHGDRHTFALVGRRAVRGALASAGYDVVVEDVNKLPLYTPGLTRLPVVAVIPHLFGSTAFHEAPWPVATVVVAAERLIPVAYRRAHFHVISESTRDDLVGRGISADRIVVIHPGVDSTRFTPDPALDRTDPASFLYVGRLRRYKGVEFAIRALALARNARPELTLDVAGAGDDRRRLEELTGSLGQQGAVRFHGFVDEAAKLRLLRRTWANVFPSPKEGWGITVMEAAAAGTPSIASDSPGLRDSVVRGVTGFLVPHGDVPALARRMLELASDPALVARLGAAAREQATRWSWDDAAAATTAHLESVLGAVRRPDRLSEGS
jgi:glycosyltransferase involved in cell wall biosynthesis